MWAMAILVGLSIVNGSSLIIGIKALCLLIPITAYRELFFVCKFHLMWNEAACKRTISTVQARKISELQFLSEVM